MSSQIQKCLGKLHELEAMREQLAKIELEMLSIPDFLSSPVLRTQFLRIQSIHQQLMKEKEDVTSTLNALLSSSSSSALLEEASASAPSSTQSITALAASASATQSSDFDSKSSSDCKQTLYLSPQDMKDIEREMPKDISYLKTKLTKYHLSLMAERKFPLLPSMQSLRFQLPSCSYYVSLVKPHDDVLQVHLSSIVSKNHSKTFHGNLLLFFIVIGGWWSNVLL